jgi:hypothetical protein
MRPSSVISSSTRIIPAKEHKAVEVTKQSDGSLAVRFANGTAGNLDDKDLQAFVIWTMANPECTE